MSTVDKALSLLQHFSVLRPEIGLSEFSRLSGQDKTTVLRCLTALHRNGFVEQDEVTRRYRLGLAPMTLARMREQSFPMQALLKPHLARLSERLGETAHVTLVNGASLMTGLISEPERAARVFMDPSAMMPVHATASGIAILAFLPRERQQAWLDKTTFQRFTDHTPHTRAQVEQLVATARTKGFARSEEWFEQDVIGTAVPIFGPSGLPAGAVAVAAVASRFDAALAAGITAALFSAAATITQELGGVFPLTPPAAADFCAPV